jgi:hypothetical protein
MGLDLQAEIDRLLGSDRAVRARWLLGLLSGRQEAIERPEQLAEILGSLYRQPERFLPNLLFWKQRLGSHEATSPRLGDDGVLEVDLCDAKGRVWTFRARIGLEPPHRIEFWSVRRPLPPGVTLRRATEADADAIAAVERACPIERNDGSRVALVRGKSVCDQVRFAEWGGIWIVEERGTPIACDARLAHRARVAGRDVTLAYRFHTRVAPSHRRLGLNETLGTMIAEEQVRAGVVGDGTYVYVDPRNQTIRDWSPTPAWRERPLRALFRCDAIAGPPSGRPASPADAARIAPLLDSAHEGEELYLPFTAERVTGRLSRQPDSYSFTSVWVDDLAIVGVWEDRERRTLERAGAVEESVRATVLDWGFSRHSAEGLRSLEKLLRSWCAYLAPRGITHLSLFFSAASPAAPMLRRLAASVIDIEFQSTIPEPATAGEHGLHVDPIYY